MTQRQTSHPEGTFPTCPDCGREPRHLIDARRRPVGGHLLSCYCGDTPKFEGLSEAVRAWCRIHNAPMTVRPARRGVVTPLRQVPA